MKLLIIILVILIIGCTNNEDFSFSEEKEKKIVLPQDLFNDLKGGEIILRKGKGYLSNLIVDLLGEKLSYSHAGIVIKDSAGVYIIHSLSGDVSNVDGVQMCSLSDFLVDIADSSLCIIKPKVDSLGLLSIQIVTKEYLKLGIPFDHDFDMKTKDKLHCSELVHDVLQLALSRELLPITTRAGVEVVQFSNFFNSTNFEVVFELKPYSKALK